MAEIIKPGRSSKTAALEAFEFNYRAAESQVPDEVLTEILGTLKAGLGRARFLTNDATDIPVLQAGVGISLIQEVMVLRQEFAAVQRAILKLPERLVHAGGPDETVAQGAERVLGMVPWDAVLASFDSAEPAVSSTELTVVEPEPEAEPTPEEKAELADANEQVAPTDLNCPFCKGIVWHEGGCPEGDRLCSEEVKRVEDEAKKNARPSRKDLLAAIDAGLDNPDNKVP